HHVQIAGDCAGRRGGCRAPVRQGPGRRRRSRCRLVVRTFFLCTCFMDAEPNLLFGVLAVKTELLEPAQLADAYRAWAAQPDTPLGEFLLERGALAPEAKERVD